MELAPGADAEVGADVLDPAVEDVEGVRGDAQGAVGLAARAGEVDGAPDVEAVEAVAGGEVLRHGVGGALVAGVVVYVRFGVERDGGVRTGAGEEAGELPLDVGVSEGPRNEVVGVERAEAAEFVRVGEVQGHAVLQGVWGFRSWSTATVNHKTTIAFIHHTREVLGPVLAAQTPTFAAPATQNWPRPEETDGASQLLGFQAVGAAAVVS
ncbi:hypothetical protein ACIOMM_31245 [Streptomyces sp. NPDC087908]|uniref:hypothetical protein n=1 Tax=Streptomyces sp. NPDC087908 TaxID=3365820 RepID=UPI003825859A